MSRWQRQREKRCRELEGATYLVVYMHSGRAGAPGDDCRSLIASLHPQTTAHSRLLSPWWLALSCAAQSSHRTLGSGAESQTLGLESSDSGWAASSSRGQRGPQCRRQHPQAVSPQPQDSLPCSAPHQAPYRSRVPLLSPGLCPVFLHGDGGQEDARILSGLKFQSCSLPLRFSGDPRTPRSSVGLMTAAPQGCTAPAHPGPPWAEGRARHSHKGTQKEEAAQQPSPNPPSGPAPPPR